MTKKKNYNEKKIFQKRMKGGASILPTILNDPTRDLNDVSVIVGHGQTGNQFDLKDNINIITSVDYGFSAMNNNSVINYLKDFLVKIDFS